jgi:hypothetical protein
MAATGFEGAWHPLALGFQKFRLFWGGLATVFSGTATVAFNFSVLMRRYDEFRSSLTELSLEYIMQGKKFRMLIKLYHSPEHT